MESSKISARRYGRLLAVLSLKNKYLSGNNIDIIHLYQEIATKFSLTQIPSSIEKQILGFSTELLKGIENHFEVLIKMINTYSKNRSWDKFAPLDQALLLVGTYDLGHNSSIPKICIKETLIISDMMQNENAAPYLSGILKTIAYGNKNDTRVKTKKKPIIRLKNKETN